MPVCKNCGNDFPNFYKVGEKRIDNRGRSYCKECSPIGERVGPSLKRKAKENKHIYIGSTIVKTCPTCLKEHKGARNNVCATCRTWYQRYKRRNKYIEKLGGKCCRCGIDDFDCLHFHHKNAEEKNFSLSAGWSLNEQIIEKEVDKCELLCANCHIKEHKNEKQNVIDYYSKKESKDQEPKTQ